MNSKKNSGVRVIPHIRFLDIWKHKICSIFNPFKHMYLHSLHVLIQFLICDPSLKISPDPQWVGGPLSSLATSPQSNLFFIIPVHFLLPHKRNVFRQIGIPTSQIVKPGGQVHTPTVCTYYCTYLRRYRNWGTPSSLEEFSGQSRNAD
jgi:hypothetical protein